MEESARQEFVAKMRDIFANIVNEETFVETSLVQDMRDPQSILNYEVWNDGPQPVHEEPDEQGLSRRIRENDCRPED
jgi:quinol monooxygenase YgiN